MRSDEPSNPNTGAGANASCDSTQQTCPRQEQPASESECPTVEIEINDTPTTTDDLVQLKWTHPARYHKVPCRIRAISSGDNRTIVLTNPDGRLRFSTSGATTKTVSVPSDGSWMPFDIYGENGSAAMNDAVIEAHCGSAVGALKGKKEVTVFWFDKAKIDITPGGKYTIDVDRFTTIGGVAVSYSAEARIRPAGVDCSAPQVKDLRIGIMQNVFGGIVHQRTWNNPSIVWNSAVPSGTQTMPIQTLITSNTSLPKTVNDSDAVSTPLYQRGASALRPPIGCTGGAASVSNDTPNTGLPALEVPIADTSGYPVGTVTFQRSIITTISFITWAAVFNITTEEFSLLRERTWDLNVQFPASSPQRATVASSDREPTTSNVTSPNANNSAVQSTPVMSGSTQFTHP